MPKHRVAAALAAILGAAGAAQAQSIERHPTSPPGIILQAVEIPPGAATLHLSGQVAAPLDSTLATPSGAYVRLNVSSACALSRLLSWLAAVITRVLVRVNAGSIRIALQSSESRHVSRLTVQFSRSPS